MDRSARELFGLVIPQSRRDLSSMLKLKKNERF